VSTRFNETINFKIKDLKKLIIQTVCIYLSALEPMHYDITPDRSSHNSERSDNNIVKPMSPSLSSFSKPSVSMSDPISMVEASLPAVNPTAALDMPSPTSLALHPLVAPSLPQSAPWPHSNLIQSPVNNHKHDRESDLASKYYSHRRKRQTSSELKSLTVRLSNTTEGRVEVQLDNQWGPVCGHRFGMQEAAVVCQQMGLVLDRDDWRLSWYEYPALDGIDRALLSNVRCSPFDTNLGQCLYESRSKGEFDNSCRWIAGVRCVLPSWSGLRFGLAAREATLQHFVIQNAGLHDYATYSFKPALQIDLNRFRLLDVRITGSRASGLGVLWNDLFSEQPLEIRNGEFSSNRAHGVESHSHGLQLIDSRIADNHKSGFHFEPRFTRNQLHELMSWLAPIDGDKLVTLPDQLPSNGSIYLPPRHPLLLRIQPQAKVNASIKFALQTATGHSIGVLVLNPPTEPFSDSIKLTYSNRQFDLRSNATSFSSVHFAYRVGFEYEAGPQPSGDLLLYVCARPITVSTAKSLYDLEASENLRAKQTRIVGNRFELNRHAFSSRHYEHSLGSEGEWFARFDNETFEISNNAIENQQSFAILIRQPMQSKTILIADPIDGRSLFSEIHFNLIRNRFAHNRAGIRQTTSGGNRRASTNVFHWTVTNCTYDSNQSGGVQLHLPHIRYENANHTHSITIHQNRFHQNQAFRLHFSGHFAKLNVTFNWMIGNRSPKDLLKVSGTEKCMWIADNLFERNRAEHLVQFDVDSHTHLFDHVSASFIRNTLLRNQAPYSTVSTERGPLPSHHQWPTLDQTRQQPAVSYALGVSGVQLINVSRNLLHNPELQYELLAGVRSESLDTRLDVRLNWWGASDARIVRDRIFDFDDWNCFASADFSPFLAAERIDALPVIADDQFLDWQEQARTAYDPLVPNTIGGRLLGTATLRARSVPYIVRSDLTVMPNVTLRIEPGVTLEFYPGVGILTLGSLQAIGTLEEPIVMRPLQQALVGPLTRVKRDVNESESTAPILSSSPPMDLPTDDWSDLWIDKWDEQRNADQGTFERVQPIRLCRSDACDEFVGDGLFSVRDGFLELFNSSTGQWVPICDREFSERNARVVCRQLGFSSLNVHLRHGPRLDSNRAAGAHVRFWPSPVQCDGSERTLSDCEPTLWSSEQNGDFHYLSRLSHDDSTSQANDDTYDLRFELNNRNAGRHPDRSLPITSGQASTACWPGNTHHIYVKCGDEPRAGARDYWGGVRIASSHFEPPSLDSFQLNRQSSLGQYTSDSRMQFVRISGAGVLHGHRAAAIQLVRRDVNLEFIEVNGSAWHGLQAIAPAGHMLFEHLNIHHNLGVGLHYVLLGGAGRAAVSSAGRSHAQQSFSGDNTLPPHIYGLVDLCGAGKRLTVNQRLLVYHVYDAHPVECVKTFVAPRPGETLAFRMLQFRLPDAESDDESSDDEGKGSTTQNKSDWSSGELSNFLQVLDGDLFNSSARVLAHFESKSHFTRSASTKLWRLVRGSRDALSIRLQSTGGDRRFAVVAEILASRAHPVAGTQLLNVSSCDVHDNVRGAMLLRGAGGLSSSLSVADSTFVSNCDSLFGNFSTCSCAIDLQCQPPPALRLERNLFESNIGGLCVRSTGSNALHDAWISRNVFANNRQQPALAFDSPPTPDPDQFVQIYRNVFTRNQSPMQPTVRLRRVLCNLTENVFAHNSARQQVLLLAGAGQLPVDPYDSQLIDLEPLHSFGANRADRSSAEADEYGARNGLSSSSAVRARLSSADESNVDDQLLLRQEMQHNWLYANSALDPNARCTLLAIGAGARLSYNYLLNVQNDFELCAGNDSIPTRSLDHDRLLLGSDLLRPVQPRQPIYSIQNGWLLPFQQLLATDNWWGDGNVGFVSGRIRQPSPFANQHVRVQWKPFLATNQSLLSDGCAGGWRRLGSGCFLFVQARLRFDQARTFCEQENSTMPFVSVNQRELSDLLLDLDSRYDPLFHPIWVQSFQYSPDECTALVNRRVTSRSCEQRLSFVCEKDPPGSVTIALYQDWHRHQLVLWLLALCAASATFAMLCVACWFCKSRQRHKQKLQRRNSLRASIRSNRSYSLSDGSLNEYAYKKHIEKAIQAARVQHQQQHQHQQQQQQVQSNSMVRLNPTHLPAPSNLVVNHHGSAFGSSTFRLPTESHGSYESFEQQQSHHGPSSSNNRYTIKANGAQSMHRIMNSGRPIEVVSSNGSLADQVSAHNYNTLNGRPDEDTLEDRFTADPALENANIQLLVKPTFDLTYENAGFRETPNISRASNREYAEAREWSPIGESFDPRLITQPGGHPSMTTMETGSLYQKHRKPNHSNAAVYAMQSYADQHESPGPRSVTSHVKPLPPVARYRSIQQATNTNPRKSSLPDHLNSFDRDMSTFGSRSQSTLFGTAGSDVGSQDRRYLETSLDNDSLADQSQFELDFDPASSSLRYSPSTSTATQSTRKEQPLETAM
jgi:hypothetical protein